MARTYSYLDALQIPVSRLRKVFTERENEKIPDAFLYRIRKEVLRYCWDMDNYATNAKEELHHINSILKSCDALFDIRLSPSVQGYMNAWLDKHRGGLDFDTLVNACGFDENLRNLYSAAQYAKRRIKAHQHGGRPSEQRRNLMIHRVRDKITRCGIIKYSAKRTRSILALYGISTPSDFNKISRYGKQSMAMWVQQTKHIRSQKIVSKTHISRNRHKQY